MKLLVTGGAGFIGSHFILYWMKHHPEDKIVNIDKLTYAANIANLEGVQENPNYEFVCADICNADAVEENMQGVDIIVHFAAETHVDRSIMDPLPFIHSNVVGTYILLEAAKKHNVQRFHHISCYDSKTRAMTRRGLLRYWELTNNDEVLSLNPKTKQIEWKKIEKVIIQDYKGEMVDINSDKLHMKVTPNHRMLLQTNRTKKLQFKEARNLGSVNNLPEGVWKSNVKIDKNFMYLLGYFIGDGCLSYQEKKNVNISGLNKRAYLAQFRDSKTGQFMRTSHVGVQKYTISHSYRIFLDVPVKDKGRKRLEKTLNDLNINWHPHSGKAGEHIYFSSKKIGDIFKDCGKDALQKKIPEWALEGDRESLQALFEGLIDADGSWGKPQRLYTSSFRLVETFSELCIKLGYIPHVFERKSKGNYYKRRLIKGNTSYVITVTKQHRSIRIGSDLNQVQKSKYDGVIWCVKVPENKNLLVEREGTFLFCGNTDEVFGSIDLDDPSQFTEETKYEPSSPYSATKAGADHLVRAYHHTYRVPITISNCSNNYGPAMYPEKLIPIAITNLLEGKKVPVHGDGRNVRDWLYVEDHVRAIELILKKGRVGETYLVGGMNKGISNEEVVKRILKIMGKSDDEIKFVKDRKGNDRKYDVDWSKIHRELGWEPLHGLDVWLERTIRWYEENRSWWEKIKAEDYKDILHNNLGGDVDQL